MLALLFIVAGALLNLLRLYASRRHAMVGLGYPLWMAIVFSIIIGGIGGLLVYWALLLLGALT